MAEIKQIQVPGVTVPYEINAKYIQDTEGNAKSWSNITELISAQTDLVPLDELPTASTATYNTYKNDIVLIPAATSATGNERDEYMIFKDSASAYHWEKIGTTAADLSTKADKGTYTTSQSGAVTTSGPTQGTGTAYTATGTASVSYKKSDAATGSAGGHNHTVTAPTASFVTGVKSTGGTANVVTGYGSFSGGSLGGTTSFNTDAIKNVKLTSATATSTGAVAYLDGISGSAPSLGGTKTFNTNGIKSVALSSSDTSTDGPTYVQSVSYTAATLTGTKTFNTDAIKDVTLSASDTSTDGPAYVSAVSGSFNTDAIKNVKLTAATTTSTGAVTYVESISGTAATLTGTKTFVTGYGSFSGGSFTQGAKASFTQGSKAAWSASVSNAGVLSFSWTTNGNDTFTANGNDTFTAASLGAASTGTVGISGGSYSSTTKYLTGSGDAATKSGVGSTTKYMKRTTTAAGTGTVGISGGSINATTKYMKATGTAADTGTVTISGGEYTGTTKYLTGSGDAATKATVTFTPASLGTASTVAVIKSDGLATGNAVTSVSLADAAGHTHSIGLTDTNASGTASVNILTHTHTIGNHTHSVTI